VIANADSAAALNRPSLAAVGNLRRVRAADERIAGWILDRVDGEIDVELWPVEML
jgi:hypothetical protein